MVTVAGAPKSVTLWHKEIIRLLLKIEKQTSESSKKATKRSARRFLHSPFKYIQF